MRTIFILPLWCAITCTSCNTSKNENSIEDFNNVSSHSNWLLASDEYATGSLSFTSTDKDMSAHLMWDVTEGGRRISAQYTIQQVPADAKGIRLNLKCSGVSTAWLYITDSGSQRYEYKLERSLTDLDDQKWFSQTLIFSAKPDSIFNGKNKTVDPKNIASIAVAIEPRMDSWYPSIRWFPQPKGEMWFDDIEWVNNLDEPLQYIDKANQPIMSETLWSRVGVCTDLVDVDSVKQTLLKNTGFSVVRSDLHWSNVERVKGVYDFSFYDGMVSIAEHYNLRTILILVYGNELYTKDGLPPTTPEQINAYTRFCAAAAKHYSRHASVDFEVWNEPNLFIFWKPLPDALEFSRLLLPAVDSVKKYNKTAKVITGGTAGIDWRFIDSLGVTGALKYVDGIGIHPYRKGSPETFSEDLICLRWHTKKYFTTNPGEWATEFGASSSNYGNGLDTKTQLWQARIDVRALLANWLAGFTYATKYSLSNYCIDSANVECNYGIVSPELQPRPSYQAFQTLRKLTSNRVWNGRIPTENRNAYALQFTGETDDVFILWTSAGNKEVDSTGYKTRFLLPNKPVAVYSYLGESLPIPSSFNSTWPIEADGELVYVIVPKE